MAEPQPRGPRFLPVTPNSLLVELRDLDQTLALLAALQADPLPAIAEIVPAARTLLIRSLPGMAADAGLAAQVLARLPRADRPLPLPRGPVIEIPVIYDGADLDHAARHLDMSPRQLIEAHQAALWQVAFCGFAPGFAYMSSDDPRFDLPRRETPRTRIPAGSVALAGRFCGIYPQASPGGWQLIGRSALPVWDLSRDPPALLQPGARCRFVAHRGPVHAAAVPPPPPNRPDRPGLQVLASAFPITIQDRGRRGQAGQGVSASGALDQGALRRANRAVGNPPDTPALEITLGPVRLRADMPMVLALTGAGQAHVGNHAIPPGAPFGVDAGDLITIAPPAAGMRSYLALRGGLDVARVLGSASRDMLAHLGPDPLVAGAVLVPAHGAAQAVGAPQPQPALPGPGQLVELPVTLGPRTDWFAPSQVRRFLGQEWQVTPDASRVGIRLQGRALHRAPGELPSEGTETGAIQIPHSGQPVLFLADHPLTGGYPVIATLRPEALDLAAQIPPGARIRFRAPAAFAPITPRTPA